jgi:hypothetical protein
MPTSKALVLSVMLLGDQYIKHEFGPECHSPAIARGSIPDFIAQPDRDIYFFFETITLPVDKADGRPRLYKGLTTNIPFSVACPEIF